MNFKGKTILITGGSNGLGFQVGKILHSRGMNVYSFDKVLPERPVKGVNYISVDITDEKKVVTALKKISKIDVLLNNAGLMRRGTIFESSVQDFDLLFDVAVKGSWIVTKNCEKKFSKKPIIVFMSSRHGRYLSANPGLYALTKKFLIDFAVMLKKTRPNCSVKVACPGPFDTAVSRHGVSKKDMKEKMKIMLTPEEMAHKIIKLMESDKSMLLYNNRKNEYSYAY